MKKVFVPVLVFFLMTCALLLTIEAAEHSDVISDMNYFLQEFSKAIKVNDEKKMMEIVRRAESIVCNTIMEGILLGIKEKLKGGDDPFYFDFAEEISKVYAKGFNKKGLLELVKGYRNYTQEMCRQKVAAHTLLEEGKGFRGKAQWKEALGKFEEALRLFDLLGDIYGKGITYEGMGDVYKHLGQNKEALNYYQKSLEISRRIGDVLGEAESLKDIGITYDNLGEYIEALNYYEQALKISGKIGDFYEAMILNNSGLAYEILGQYSQAMTNYEKALNLFRKIRNLRGEAGTLNSLGNIYSYLGQYRQSLDCLRKAAEISNKIEDAATEAKAWNNMGVVYKDTGEYTKALDHHEKALKIFQNINDKVEEAKAIINIGIVYENLGQLAKALQFYRETLEITQKIGDNATEAKALGNIGNIYRGLGQYTESLKYYERGIDICRRTKDLANEALFLKNIGVVYLRTVQPKRALDYFQGALLKFENIRNTPMAASTRIDLGNLYSSTGHYKEGLQYYLKAYESSREIGDIPGEVRASINSGTVYLELGQYKDLINVFRECIKISEQLGELEQIWRAYRGLGGALWKSGRREEAVDCYKKAVKVIEELYQSTKGLKEKERSSMIGEKSFVYQEFIELLLELHRKQPTKGYDREAFRISEKSKSRTFQELMAKAGAKTVFSGDETFKKMIEKEQQLIGELTNLRSLFTKEMSKPEKQRNEEVVKSLEKQISKVEKTLTDLEKEIEVKYPRYADLKRPKPLTVEELQAILKPDETILSYAVGKEKLTAFVITKKSFKLIEIDSKREDLSKLVKNFRKGLEDISALDELEAFDPEMAYKLYQKLFQPLSSELKGVTKLYLSADDVLYTLPFEALVDKEIDAKAFREARRRGRNQEGAYLMEYATLHYLIDTYTITYLPSASVLRSLRKYENPGYGKWSKPLIAFADPIFSEKERKEEIKDKDLKPKGVSQETRLMVQLLTRSTGSMKLERLKESAQEAEAISKELESKKEDIYLREKATEENVYSTNLKDSRYILFSTHGLLGGDFSGVAEPALALTLVDNPPGRDGFLTMSEVLGLDLNSELIILSACNTSGKGDKAGSGEGFVGLTRSFMYAGSKSLLVTHWSVESEAARDLMVGAMKLMKNKTKPEALREAKLNMKKSIRQTGKEKLSLSHPFFWAPFVLVGEGK
jgi:tetratricopeptide (TPR) repeat protein